MKRRDFIKSLGLGLSAGLIFPNKNLRAWSSGNQKEGTCRIVIFAPDGLSYQTAIELVQNGAPGLCSLYGPICSLSTGLSQTQPGWASIWTGLPSYYTRAFCNKDYDALPHGTHVFPRIMNDYKELDLFSLWLTGKGHNIRGDIPESPHYEVSYKIRLPGTPGHYLGDAQRDSENVYRLAATFIMQAAIHENFICFIHFADPDQEGHLAQNYDDYLDKAMAVDEYIYDLMHLLPDNTDVIYCSDHGFNFTSLGDTETGHQYAPQGILATNFPIRDTPYICQHSIGRLIYTRSGGNLDDLRSGANRFQMYGIDLV